MDGHSIVEVTRLEAENARMLHALAVLAENRRLRQALGAAGLPVPMERRPTLHDLAVIICDLHPITVEDLVGPGSDRTVSDARQQFMWSARQVMVEGQHRWSLQQVGRFLGGRDHTTVRHGVAQHERRCAGATEGGEGAAGE